MDAVIIITVVVGCAYALYLTYRDDHLHIRQDDVPQIRRITRRRR